MNPNRKLYRDKINGKLGGVCAGIADYFGINSAWPRLIFLILFFIGAAPFLIIGYLIAALIIDKKPPQLYTESLVRTFYDPNDDIMRKKP